MRFLCHRAVEREHWLPHCSQLNTSVGGKNAVDESTARVLKRIGELDFSVSAHRRQHADRKISADFPFCSAILSPDANSVTWRVPCAVHGAV